MTDYKDKEITQIALSLKTRLSFAFVKMQNGWADQSLDQIEQKLLRRSQSLNPSPVQSPILQQSLTAPNTPGRFKASLHRRGNSSSHHQVTNQTSPHRRSAISKKYKKNMTIHVPYPTPAQSLESTGKSSEEEAVETLMYLSSPRASTSNTAMFTR